MKYWLITLSDEGEEIRRSRIMADTLTEALDVALLRHDEGVIEEED